MKEVDKKLSNTCENGNLEKIKQFVDIAEEVYSLFEVKQFLRIPKGRKKFEKSFLEVMEKAGRLYGLTIADEDDGSFFVGFEDNEYPYHCHFWIWIYDKKIVMDLYLWGNHFLWEFPNFLFKKTLKKIEKLWETYNYNDRIFKEYEMWKKMREIDKKLLDACEDGNLEKVKQLLERGADVNVRGKDGETALMIVSWYGKKKIAELLIKKGIDLNAKDNFGRTALMYASWYGHKEIVKLLLEAGADVNAQDKDDITALMYAFKNGDEEIIKLLKSYEAEI
jgi:hypothetical protein